jgi:hypothetical protein
MWVGLFFNFDGYVGGIGIDKLTSLIREGNHCNLSLLLAAIVNSLARSWMSMPPGRDISVVDIDCVWKWIVVLYV